MKRSFKRRYHTLLMILLGIVLLQSVLIFFTLSKTSSLKEMVGEIQTLLIIFFFIIFVYVIIIYNYIPYRNRRAYREIGRLIEEISQGNYQIDIDSTLYDQDGDVQELILSLQKMLNIIMRFDIVKADKIYEHHQRIYQLINILPQGILILSISGDVIYCNDRVRIHYDFITEGINLNETIFPNPFDSRVFSAISHSLRHGTNLYGELIQDDKSGRRVIIDASIIRNRKGQASGSVFAIEFTGNAPKDQDHL